MKKRDDDIDAEEIAADDEDTEAEESDAEDDAEADDDAEVAPEPEPEPPIDEAEVARRTAIGLARWLIGTTVAFWLAIILFIVGIIKYHMETNQAFLFLILSILLGSLVIAFVLYLAVMLEAAVFTNRRIKVVLAISYANMAILTLILKVLIPLTNIEGFSAPHMGLTVAVMLISIAVLVYAFRTNRRYVFLLAVFILLAANLITVPTPR